MIIKLLFIASLILQTKNTAEIGNPSLQTEQKDSVKTEMVLRSEDLIWESNWSYFSIDRMSFKVNSGHFGYYGPQPSFLMNEIPFDPTFLGMNFSQLLPVSFGRIQNLEFIEGLGNRAGIGYYSGLVDITTVALEDGLSVYALGQYGHNSDEPGPWIFDRQQVTPNVERFGPWADAGASLKIGPWYAKGLLRSHSYLNINPHVQTRTKNLVGLPEQSEWPDPRATTYLRLAETGIKSENFNLTLQAVQTDSEELLYFQPIAREVPTKFSTEQYSASTKISISDFFGLRAMVQYRDKVTGYRRNRFEEKFDWSQVKKNARSSIFLDTERFVLDIGTDIKEIETEARGLGDFKQRYIELFLDQQITITSWLSIDSHSNLTLHDNEETVRFSGGFDFRPFGMWSTSIRGSYLELLPEYSNPFDVWVIRGYDIMNHLDSYAFVRNKLPNTEQMTISNRHRLELSDLVRIELKAEYLQHISFHIPFQDARYYLQLSTLPGGYFLFDDQKGERFRFSFNTDLKWTTSVRQSFWIHYATTLSGDIAYKSYWNTTPEWLIRHSTFLTPYPDLDIRLNVQYQSEAVWDEFRRLDGRLNRTFHPQFPYRIFSFSNKVPSGVHIDLIISKWFWEQRIRAVFMLSNLFNQKYRTHPIGSEEGFGYMLRMELRI